MRKFFFLDFRRPRPEDRLSQPERKVTYLLLFMFACGILAGSLIGLYSPPAALPADVEDYVASEVLSRSAGAALWSSGRFFLLLLILSTSWLGVVLSPVSALARGYLLGCSVSALFRAYSYRGLLFSFLISGVPAAVIVPCFLFAARDAFFSAQRLLTRRFGGGPEYGSSEFARHFPAIVLLVLLDTAYACYLLPVLLRLL